MPAPDLSATLTGVAGQFTDVYWQLATWIDLYALELADDTRKP